MNFSNAGEATQAALKAQISWVVADTPSACSRLSATERLMLWANRVESFWRYPLLKSNAANVILFLIIAAVCAVRASIGVSGFQRFSHDAFMPLDGAWRLLHGQRPHLDFYSFMGVLVYVPTMLGLLLSRGGAEGFGYGQALAGLFFGLWACVLTRKRLPDVPAMLFSLAIVLLVTAPYPLGYTPLDISPATTYNRYGYAALALILLEAVVQRRLPEKPYEFRGGLSSGSLLVMLFFLKFTFFGAGVFLMGMLALCRTQTRRRWAGIGASCFTVSLAFCTYFGFHLMPMMRDLLMVGGAKRIHLRGYLFEVILTDTGVLICFTITAALLLVWHKRSRQARSLAIAGAAVCITGAVLIFGNCEPYGTPLAIFFVLIAVGQFTFPATGTTPLLRLGVLIWGSIFTITSLAPAVIGFGYASVLSAHSVGHKIPMKGTVLKTFVSNDSDGDYRAFVNDGLELIGQHRLPDDTVMSLDFSNPFSYGLGLLPAHGGTTALQYQTTFNDAHRPTAEWLFGSASLVMVPKTYSEPSLEDSIPRLYGGYLNSHFRPIGESRRWRLYRAVR